MSSQREQEEHPALSESITNDLSQRLEDPASRDGAQSISRRRQSSIASSRAGLTFGDLPSAVPPPIPESLPTTPGYELSDMFDPSLVGRSDDLPQQQRPQLKKLGTATTITKLLEYDDKIPPELQDSVMSIHNPPLNLYRVIAGCVFIFTVGMSDGALGALLPHIEAHYGISYGLVSLLWLGNAIGYITIAFTAHYVDRFLGLQKTLTVSVACFTIMFALISSGTLFPVLVVAFFCGGLGGALALSQYNIFLSKLQNGSKYLGTFHGSYGLGAFVSPILGTVMVNAGAKWNFFYFIPLGMSVVSLVFTPLAFKGCHIDLKRWENVEITDVQAPPTADPGQNDNPLDTINSRGAIQEATPPPEPEQNHDFISALKDYRSWLICSFIFFYQGAEVSIGGWMVTFLLDYRGGNSGSVGYVASGFWAGITIGRFVLTYPFTKWFGVRRSIIVLQLLIMILDILAWLIPNIIVEAFCACLIGLCIGPVYPMMVGLLTRILPRKIRFCSMTLGTAFGSSGGSAVPFAVGMASQFVGTFVLHPIFLGCYFCMLLSWLAMPNIERKGTQHNLFQRLW